MTTKTKFQRNHGSLYDRGGADSYYRRPVDPHWYPKGTYNGERIDKLTQEEIEEYMKGYNENDDFKDWG
jgi:hypothetical protein